MFGSTGKLDALFRRELHVSIAIVLLAFLAIFWFFDFVGELADVGRGGYGLGHALAYTSLHLPSMAYELIPVAALIGAVYAMARLANDSEFTILRGAGLGPWRALSSMIGTGVLLAAATLLLGEVVVPEAEQRAQRLLSVAKGKAASGSLSSGRWLRNVNESVGAIEAINVLADREGRIERLLIYRFDREARLLLRVESSGADYKGNGRWILDDVRMFEPRTDGLHRSSTKQWEWLGGPEPSLLQVNFISPEQMTIVDLWRYTRHMSRSGQVSDRHQLALWKKGFFPLTALVMMALALPFAYLHARSGAMSLKVFGGIMIGLSFVLLNGLVSQIGLLNTWPPMLVALAPATMFTVIALCGLAWVLRVH
jgi:lipopolysaccharide export system permease protein